MIKIKDIYKEENGKKDNFKLFVRNIEKFLFLREIRLRLTKRNYEEIFNSEELDILIKNLFTLKLLEKIDIKIYNPKIKLSKEYSKLFKKMEIKEEIKGEKKYLTLFWEYSEK